jgi:two-component system response regulator MtrA
MMSAPRATRATVLLAEDDPTLATMLGDGLGARGYRTCHAASAAEAEALLDEVRPDLIIVDLTLPDRHGLLLCATFKERTAAPIIICSATRRKDDQALGFKLGADDFVAKPFSVDELEVRMEAALGRAAAPAPIELRRRQRHQRIGELFIDHSRCRATLGGETLRLTPTEYRLLCALASRPDEVFSRQELAESVWGYHDAGVTRSLDVHMRRLRAKLNAGPVSPPPLVTVRGFGYQIVQERPVA